MFLPSSGHEVREYTLPNNFLLPLVSAEYTLRKRTSLKQGEAQKDGVAHNTPDRADDVIAECDRLNQHRINAYADHNQESLESDCKQRTQIILSDIALLSVSKGGKWNRGKADHQINFNHSTVDDHKDDDCQSGHRDLYDKGL